MSLAGTLVSWVQRLAARRGRPMAPARQRLLVIVTLAVFVVIAVLSARALHHDDRSLRWGYLALAALMGAPLTVGTNAAEYAYSARILDRRVGFAEALMVSSVAVAANLLPLPGSLLVRVRSLGSHGVRYGDATSVSLVMGVGWLAMTSLIAGVVLAGEAPPVVCVLLVVAGLVLLGGVGLWARRWRDPMRTLGAVSAIEGAAVFAAAIRFWLVLRGLDTDVSFGAATAVSASGVLSSLLGIFPGGLGARELLAAGLGSLVDVGASAAALASVADRLVLAVLLAPLTALLAVHGRRAAS